MRQIVLKCKKIIAASLMVAILMTNAGFVTYASEITTEANVQNSTDVNSVKEDLTLLEGTLGDTYLEYTYEENNETYKVVEYANEEYTNIFSKVYLLDDSGVYNLQYTQTFTMDENGEVDIVIDKNGTVENRTISSRETICSESAPFATNNEWITSSSDSYKGGLKGLTYAAIYGIIKGVLIAKIKGDVKGGIITGVTTVTDYIFKNGLEKVYYHSVYNWRRSPKNYFLIDETASVSYYKDSAHKYFISSDPYYEYIN